MSQELIYTSAPQGIKPGSHGFCTVAYSRGMSANLIQQLESLSGYRHIYGPQDPNAALNPVAFSHLVFTVGGRRCHVLSRICDAGLDYSQRTNKLAHHVMLDAAEVPPAGPAALMARDSFMRTKWKGEPSILPTGPAVPSDESPPRVCRAWQQLVGDAGWAGVLAETATGAANRQVVLIYRPGTDMLALLVEALGLLPVNVRWRVSFSTYYTKLPAGIGCQWRCVVDGTPEAAAARKSSQGTLVLDLCRPLGRAAGSIYVEMARTGKLPIAKSTAPKVAATQLGDKELERVLREFDELPVSPGVGLRQPLEVNVGEYAVVPLPPALPSRPPVFRPRHFKRKQPRRWPWVLGIPTMILLVIAGGLVLWTTLSGTPSSSLAVRSDTRDLQNSGKDSLLMPHGDASITESKGNNTDTEAKGETNTPTDGISAEYLNEQPEVSSENNPKGGSSVEPEGDTHINSDTPKNSPETSAAPKDSDSTARDTPASGEKQNLPSVNPFAIFPKAVSLGNYPTPPPTGAQPPYAKEPLGTIDTSSAGLKLTDCCIELLGVNEIFQKSTTCRLEKKTSTDDTIRWCVMFSLQQGEPEKECAQFLLSKDGKLEFSWTTYEPAWKSSLDLFGNCLLKLSYLKSTFTQPRVVRLRKAEVIKKSVDFDNCNPEKIIVALKYLPKGAKPLLRVIDVVSPLDDKGLLNASFPPPIDEKLDITFGTEDVIYYSIHVKSEKVVLKYVGVKLANLDDWHDLSGVVIKTRQYQRLKYQNLKSHQQHIQDHINKRYNTHKEQDNIDQNLKRQMVAAEKLTNCLAAIQSRATLCFSVYIIVDGNEVGLATTELEYDYGNRDAHNGNK